MKIGILTFTHTGNYGAALQAYALQYVIASQGQECEIIDYPVEAILNSHHPARVVKQCQGFAKKLISPLTYLIYAERLKKFERFNQEYCRMSEKQYSCKTATQMAEDYDRIVVGSDQVWNTVLTNGDSGFFLPFAKNDTQRTSYAASFGSDYLLKGDREKYEKMLAHFSVLSLREKTGQQLLSKALKRQIRHDLDPTLLLPPDKWMNFVSERPHNRDYIFTYLLPEREDVLQSVEKFAREKNCDIYWVRKGIRGKKGFHILTMLSPEQFLNYLYHAKYVVTGSFHALCFSIIYQKEFYYTMSSAAERSVRLVDLAEDLGITNRKLRNGVQNTDPIPYDEIATQLEQKRAQSMQTIRVICEQ